MTAPAQSAFHRRDWIICLLLCLASIHCVRSIFLVNVSYINLDAYAAGTEQMPFQGRVGMMPLVRWAPGSPAVRKLAAFFDASLVKTPHMHTPPEHVTPEKMVCILAGLVATLSALAFCIWTGRHLFGKAWWLPSVLVLAMLYTSYAARYEVEFWYPYDLPHFALFGIAAACLLEGQYLPAFLLFLPDVPMRETSIFLLPLVLATGYSRHKLRPALGWAAAMAAVWIPVRLIISRHFSSNHKPGAAIQFHAIAVSLLNPLHWPQIASAFGFLALPLVFGWRYLTRPQQIFVLGALPGLVTTLLFGVWAETRIWSEWIIPAAILISFETVRWAEHAFTPLPQIPGNSIAPAENPATL